MSEGAKAEAVGAALRVETREEGPAVRRLEVEVPAEPVAEAFERAYRSLARSARVRGFRPGRTPVSVLRRLYGAAVAEDVERELVSETLGPALERAGLTPVSEPAVDAGPPSEDAAFVYRVRVEIRPPIELGELANLSARRPSTAVTDPDVEGELETLRQRHASLVEEPEETPAARGHFVTIDYVGRIDGQPFEGGSAREQTVELGSGHLLPGFEDQLLGARAGEDRIVRTRFPADFGSPALAGKEAEFEVHVGAVRRREVPELDDEFAKDLGDFEHLDQVRARIRESLTATRERRAKTELRRTLLDGLEARVPFDVPPGLLRERLHRRLHSAAHELEERGVRRELVERQVAQWEEEWRPAVEREIRDEWILQEVARRQGLEASDAELDERLETMAREQESEPARLRKAYREAGLLEALREQVLEDKAFAFLLSLATVEDVAGS
jgi:trigger factor